MLASDDKELIDHCRYLATQARQPVRHYEHHDIGYNYRMSNVLAAIGIGQLEVLPSRVERKREVFSEYQNRLGDLPGINFMQEAEYGKCNRWLTVATIDADVFGRHPNKLSLPWKTKTSSRVRFGSRFIYKKHFQSFGPWAEMSPDRFSKTVFACPVALR